MRLNISKHSDTSSWRERRAIVLAVLFLLLASSGCRQRMADQPRHDPLERSSFFEDGRSSRPPVPGTVARGELRLDEPFYTGKSGGRLTTAFPIPITRKMLARGQERYNIYCSPCHDRVGNGEGMVVRRGFRRPPSFHSQRLRELPAGHFFDVITRGFGTMGDYASQIAPEDRWAIVAYMRALQLSQHVGLGDLPVEDRRRLMGE